MRTKKKLLEAYLFILFIFLSAAAALRTAAALLYLDYGTGYYLGTSLDEIGDYLAAGGVIILLSYAMFAPRDAKYVASFTSPVTYAPTALVGTSLIFLAVTLIARSFSGFSTASVRSPEFLLGILSGILAALSTKHFFLNAFIKEPKADARAAASFITVTFACIYPTYLYFSSALAINSPNKLIDQIAYLATAIFLLYESRISLGRDRWRLYIAFGLAAGLLTAYSAIPSLAVYFAKGELISNSIAESVLTLCLSIFIITKLVLTRTLYDDRRADIVERIIAWNEERRGKIGDSDLTVAAPEQLSFDIGEPEASAENEAESENETETESKTELENEAEAENEREVLKDALTNWDADFAEAGTPAAPEVSESEEDTTTEKDVTDNEENTGN